MRIAFFVAGFPLVSETFILRQITGLIDLGHEVEIFAETRPEEGTPMHPEVHRYDLPSRTSYVPMPVEALMELPVWPIHGKTWTSETPTWNAQRLVDAMPALARCFATAPALTWHSLRTSQFGYEAASLSALYRLALLCRQPRRFDILHAHFGPVGNRFRFARQLFHAPLVVSFHGYDFTWWPREHGASCYQQLWRVLDCATVNSGYTGGRVRELGCPDDKIRTLPVGLDPDEFPFRERTPRPDGRVRILTVARMVEKKGLEYCIRGVAEARRRFPGIRYTIVGDGPLRQSLENLVREHDLMENVSLVGPQDGETVRRLMDDADIFLLGSVTAANGDGEGQGLVLQEAQASGLPVVATQHGPFAEGVLDGESAILIPERDAASLANALLTLLSHPDRWRSMGAAGRRFVEQKYDSRRLNRQLSELYSDVCERYRAARATATS
jgi:colanic acid/amylovoran biosynthesis glycosyltransferase